MIAVIVVILLMLAALFFILRYDKYAKRDEKHGRLQEGLWKAWGRGLKHDLGFFRRKGRPR
jgi:hypothetical protein